MDVLAVGIGFLVFSALAALVLLYNSVVFVPRNHRAVICRLGDKTRILPAGLHFIVPFVDIAHRVNWRRTEKHETTAERWGRVLYSDWLIPMHLIEHDIPPVKVDISDRLQVQVDVVFHTKVVECDIAVDKFTDPWSHLETEIANILQAQMSKKTMKEIRDASYADLTAKIVAAIQDKQYDVNVGVIIENFCIQRIILDSELLQAEINAAKRLKMSEVSFDLKLRELEHQRKLDEAQASHLQRHSVRYSTFGDLSKKAIETGVSDDQEVELATRLTAILGNTSAAQYRLGIAINRAAQNGATFAFTVPQAVAALTQ